MADVNLKTLNLPNDANTYHFRDDGFFTGTQEQWDQLTSEQKSAYEIINITDDYDAPYEEPEIWGFIDHMDILDPTQRIEYIKTNKNYTPLTIDANTHTANYGSWEGNPILQANVPAMIRANGTLDYYLDPNDYTKKLDGTASDVTDVEYAGGAFAYIPKVYSYTFIRGNDRYVMFSMTKVNNNYKAIGFMDHLGNEYDGMWIPMFYNFYRVNVDHWEGKSIGAGSPGVNSGTVWAQKDMMKAAIPSSMPFGGPIACLLNDLLMLFAKNSNLGNYYGYGNSVGGPSGFIDNAPIGGGQFYGTQDGSSLNKVFHSLVPITCQVNIRDPYIVLKNGHLYVSPYYYFDIECESEYVVDTGIDYPSVSGCYYTRVMLIPDFGIVPYPENSQSGSSELAYGDATSFKIDEVDIVANRYGNYSVRKSNGPMCLAMSTSGSIYRYSVYGAAQMLFGARSINSQGGA